MSGGTEGGPLNIAAAKKAGKDLMPIILIFVFTIIMTVAAITIFNFINHAGQEPEQKVVHEPQGRLQKQDEIFDLMQQGTRAMNQKNYAHAVRCFEKTLIVLGNQDQPILRFELNRYLAEAESARGNRARSEEYLKLAEKYRAEILLYLDSELGDLRKKMNPPPSGEKRP